MLFAFLPVGGETNLDLLAIKGKKLMKGKDS